MSEPVYLSHVRIEPYGGPMRRAYLPGHDGPVEFGVHAEIAEHYGIDEDAFPPTTTTIDYLIAAAAGWLTGTLRGALEARGINATDGPLVAEAVGEVHLDGRVLIVRKITVEYRLSGVSEEDKPTVERVLGFHAEKCPVARSISPQIEIETTLEYV